MKVLLLSFVLLPLAVLSQKSAASYPHYDNADRIVVFFLGDDIFQRYVKLDRKKSKFSPSSSSYFQYNFRHPKFSGKTFVIAFTLDSTGQFVPGDDTRGIVRLTSVIDLTWITARQALSLSRDKGHRIKKRSLRLAWDPTNVSYDIFQKTGDIRDIVTGDMVWKVDGDVLFRGDRYAGTFEVNALTGSVARRFAIPWD